MCGIAGYITLGSPEAEPPVKAMLTSLARRGPDSDGLANWPGAALGHRRLAILDLSPAGHQPMLSDDGQIGLVFNGCIYNFQELREELEERGHQFRSRCDTEVLLRGYQEWGIDALVPRLRGMFAFGIWDHPRGVLTLVRDRLGVKPLAYSARNGEIVFASTVGAVRAAGFGGEIDPLAVLEFLEYGYVTDERSIYTGIAKLPPATILEWRAGQISQRPYWTLPETDESSHISFEDAVEETERLLVESVGLRLISDVPIGVLLSGGIDSALVCWAMRERNANIKAFTVRAPDDPSDESAAAARTAHALGIAHEIVDMPEAHFSLDALVAAYSEPFACQSAQAMLWVSEAVKRRATVLLTGDGGDDVFLGYPFFRNAWLAERLANRLPDAAPAVWRKVRGMFPASGPARRLRSYLDYATGGLGAHVGAHDGLPYYEQRAILGERLAGRELAQRRIPLSLESARRLLSDVFGYHRRMHFLSEFMPKVDGGTMHYAIEARAPFLDQKIWGFAAALPPEVRFHGGRLKAVLREIVRRRVGPEVAFRKKQGFTVPVESWLAERWSGMLGRLRERTLLEEDGWVRPGSLEAPLRDAAGKRLVPVQLWRLLVLEHWLEKQSSVPEYAGRAAGGYGVGRDAAGNHGAGTNS
jgi:asparagine synthase (glutamine-hydrolysing)